MNWLHTSIVAQIVFLAYMQLIAWFNLGAWNAQPGKRGFDPVLMTMGVIQLIILFASLRRWRWLMATGVLFYLVWMVLQVRSWWVPYFRGYSPQRLRVYQQFFGQTYRFKFLPATGDHLPPDAMHVVLQLLLLAVLISGVFALFERRRTA